MGTGLSTPGRSGPYAKRLSRSRVPERRDTKTKISQSLSLQDTVRKRQEQRDVSSEHLPKNVLLVSVLAALFYDRSLRLSDQYLVHRSLQKVPPHLWEVTWEVGEVFSLTYGGMILRGSLFWACRGWVSCPSAAPVVYGATLIAAIDSLGCGRTQACGFLVHWQEEMISDQLPSTCGVLLRKAESNPYTRSVALSLRFRSQGVWRRL